MRVVPASPSEATASKFDEVVSAASDFGELLISEAVAPGKPVLHGLLVRPGLTGPDFHAFAAGPGRAAQRRSYLAGETSSMLAIAASCMRGPPLCNLPDGRDRNSEKPLRRHPAVIAELRPPPDPATA